MSNKEELAQIIHYTREIETIIKSKFKVDGNGLHQYIDSIQKYFDAAFIKDLRYLATMRNKSMHEHDFKLNNLKSYENLAIKTIAKLNEYKPIPKMRVPPVGSRNIVRINSNRRNSSSNQKGSKLKLFFFAIAILILFLFLKPIYLTNDTKSNDVSYIDSEYKKMLESKEEVTSSLSSIDKEYNSMLLAYTKPTQKPTQKFRCEGKEWCSQMSSCAEATFYIQNCPNTKMDGDGDWHTL